MRERIFCYCICTILISSQVQTDTPREGFVRFVITYQIYLPTYVQTTLISLSERAEKDENGPDAFPFHSRWDPQYPQSSIVHRPILTPRYPRMAEKALTGLPETRIPSLTHTTIVWSSARCTVRYVRVSISIRFRSSDGRIAADGRCGC